MKRLFGNIMVLAVLTILSAPASAQEPLYETPEYSGQSAKFDRSLDRYRDHSGALQASRDRLQAIQRDRRNDLAVDRHNAYRSMRVQNEMTRQREQSRRANEMYRLKTNE